MPFDLQGNLRIDYSELDNLGPEVERRTDGIKAKATIDVDSDKAKSKIDDVSKQSDKLAASIEKTHKVDVDTSSADRKLSSLVDNWHNRWTTVLDDVAGRLSNLGTGQTAKGALGGMLSGKTGALIGAGTAVGGAAIVGSIISGSVDAAQSRALMERSTKQVFGAAADQYEAQARRMADSTGYMTTSLEQAQLTIQRARAATGMKDGAVNPLVGRVADIAATTGLPQYADNVNAVSEAVARGLQGTSNALLDFGIQLDDAYVLSLKVNSGFKAMGEKITPAQMAQARYNAIMEQTAVINGKAAETQDDASRAMMKYRESVEEAKASVGEALMPIIKGVANFIANIPKPLLEVGLWVGLGAGIAATLGGAVIGIRALTSAVRDLGTQAVASAAETKAGSLLGGGVPFGGSKGLGKGTYTTGKLAMGGLSAGALGTYGLVGYMGYEATKAAWNYSSGQMNEQWAKADYAGIRTSLLQKEIMAKTTGRVVAPSAEEIADWKQSYKVDPRQVDAMVQAYTMRQEAYLTKGRKFAYGEGNAVANNIRITLVNQTGVDMDVGSYDSGSNY